MSVKAGTLRKERGHAMQGQRDMRKTNRELTKRIAELEKEVYQLTAAHQDLVRRNAMLRERPDLPAERIPAYRELLRLQDENTYLKTVLGKPK